MSADADPLAIRFQFDLPTILREAVWLGQLIPSQQQADGESAFEVQLSRFRDVLNPLGLPYGGNPSYSLARTEPAYRDELCYRPHFLNAVGFGDGLSPNARRGLATLADAVISLNQTPPSADGFDLLGSGVRLVWLGLDAEQRSLARATITEATQLWGWSVDQAGDPVPPIITHEKGQRRPSRVIDAVRWREIGWNGLVETQRQVSEAYMAEQQVLPELAKRFPTVAPENTPAVLRQAYECIATAVSDALLFMKQLHKYRGGNGFAVDEYRRAVLPVFQAASQAVQAFDSAELELRAAGSPDAFLKAVAGLKGFMTLSGVDAQEFHSSNAADLQLMVNRATTELHFYPAKRPFGENAFERMCDELARIQYLRQSPPENPAKEIPEWNRAERTLHFRGEEIRCYRRKQAPQQELVLDAFQAAGWSQCVQTELSQEESEHTVRSLNKGLDPKTVHFSQNGTGEGIAWSEAISGTCTGDAPDG